MEARYKAAFFDVDGTLIDPATHRISPKTVQVLHELQEGGTKIILATGRAPSKTPEIEGVHFDVVMNLNGGYISQDGQMLSRHAIPAADVARITENAKRMGWRYASLQIRPCISAAGRRTWRTISGSRRCR